MTLPNDAFDVIDAVHEHWVLRGVVDADEMRDELADHLDAALRDGKCVEDVTGPDLHAFADAWAAERTRESHIWKWAAVAMLIVCAISTNAVFAVVTQRSLHVRIDVADVLLIVATGAWFLIAFRSRLTRTSRPRSRRSTLVRDTVLLTAGVLAVVATVRVWGTLEVHLAPWATLLALSPLVAVVVGVFAVDVPGMRQLLGLDGREEHRAELRRRLAEHDEFERRWKPSDGSRQAKPGGSE